MSVTEITKQGSVDGSFLAQLNANFRSLGVLTQGKIYWVKPYSGSDDLDGLSAQTAFRTLRRAYNQTVAGQNDIVLLCAENNTAAKTTDYQSSNLAWAKDLVHLIGINAGGFIGQRSRISNLAAAASFADLFTLSGNGCLVQGIEFFQGAGSDTLAAAQTALKVSGQRNHIVNCQISGMGDLAGTTDYAGSNSLTLSGSENTFDDCYIGLDTVIRATSVTEVVISGGARNVFRRCHFETYTSGSTFKMISIATGCDRFIKFIDCDFVAVQNITSATAPTGVLGITTMNGQVLVRNPFVYGFANIVTADNDYVKVLGLNGLATGHLIGLAQSVDVT